jgi:superfamily I DNA/RNA helicase/RecB family exonuclease
VRLSREQEAVVGHASGTLAVTGAAGTGKTTALLARYAALVRGGVSPSRILVLARDRGAADRFVDATLPILAGGFDGLVITTFPGLAFDVLRRAGIEVRLMPGRERWAIIGHLLRNELDSGRGPELWPTLCPYLDRPAFVDEVASATARLLASGAVTRPGDGRWDELAAFVDRYGAQLQASGLIDAPLLLARAAQILEQGGRWEHVLVDDFEAATEPAARLLSAVTAEPASVVISGTNEAAIGSRWGADPRHLAAFAADADARVSLTVRMRPLAQQTLVRCHHPAVEADAIAAVLSRAADDGVPWSEMAVLLRRPRQRARAIARALARHGIPVAPIAGPLDEEPVVAALVDLLRWTGGDDTAADRLAASALSELTPQQVAQVRRDARETGQSVADHELLLSLRGLRDALAARSSTESPAALAGRAFRMAFGGLVTEPGAGGASSPDRERDDDRALDAVVAFLAELDGYVERHPTARLPDYLATLDAPDDGPDPWLAVAHAPDAVTITSVAASAGQEWHTVVLAGCVEGELPAWPRTGGVFSPAGLDDLDVSALERRRQALAEERRTFDLAVSRATGRVVATTAPEPGVLVSRFVEDWAPDDAPADELTAARAEPQVLSETAGEVPVWPGGTLALSATRLATYADCPLKFAFSYALRIRDEGNVWANLGTMFHAILAGFLEPGQPDRSWERLVSMAEDRWTDDVALYRPQRDEVRRDLYDMLERWYLSEVSGDVPDVLAVERPFGIQVGEHEVKGTIDRIDRVAGGLAIVDYKTGRKMAKAEDVVEDLQLAIYHLAAIKDPDLAALGPPVRLVLRYVRAGEDREQPITEGHAQQTEERILAAAERIVEEAFDPVVGADCDHCAFHRLCPLQAEGREVGAP